MAENTYSNVTEAFNCFLRDRLLYITNNALSELFAKYFQNPDDGKDDFWTKIANQISDVSKEAKKAFAEIMWLQYLPQSGKPKDGKDFGKKKIDSINQQLDLSDSDKLPYYDCDGCAGYGMAKMQLDSDLADLVLMFYTFTSGNNEELGTQYEIGHTFFGELIDLWDLLGSQKQMKTIQEELWKISIGPMIEAYLGNCDAKTKKEKLKKFKLAFIPE